jgi:5-methylcytosine-specific restriction endonuclease McrA
MLPTPEYQIRFLLNVQRLLGEGQFSATYKFALLMALADLSVELGDDSGGALALTASQIAEKFVEYYWRQVPPFLGRATLRQNAGHPSVVIKLLLRAQEAHVHLAEARRNAANWTALIGGVAETVRAMPLHHLQYVGRASLAFLYEQPRAKAPSTICLLPGVAYCFRRFHGFVNELVQAAWARWIRERNRPTIGDAADLHEFLFGAERASMALVRIPLLDLQQGSCFYCKSKMHGQPQVDHFIPWSVYQLDLGHNFVLAHSECNLAKRERLASEDHLAAWANRNRAHGESLACEFNRLGVLHDLSTTKRIARWAYDSLSQAGGLAWKSEQTLIPLAGDWANLLGEHHDRVG